MHGQNLTVGAERNAKQQKGDIFQQQNIWPKEGYCTVQGCNQVWFELGQIFFPQSDLSTTLSIKQELHLISRYKLDKFMY